MSCSWNALSPASWVLPACVVAATAVSKRRDPAVSVARNASSSARTTAEMRSKSVVSVGYDGLISSRTTSAKLCRTGSVTPSSRAERTIRRSSRRSTYPRPSLEGVTPSPMIITPDRAWSAITRNRTSSWVEAPYRRPENSSARAITGRTRSVS